MNARNFGILSTLAIAGLTAMTAFTPSALASTAQLPIDAQVIEPVSIQPILPLKFGIVAPNGSESVVDIDALTGTRTGNANIISSSAFQRGHFFTNDDPNPGNTFPYTVTLANNATLSNGTDTMSVVNIHHDQNPTGVVNGGGQNFLVGGRLVVGATQPAGTYTGSVTISALYN